MVDVSQGCEGQYVAEVAVSETQLAEFGAKLYPSEVRNGPPLTLSCVRLANSGSVMGSPETLPNVCSSATLRFSSGIVARGALKKGRGVKSNADSLSF